MQDTQKRQFYRSFFSIVVPIAIQQLITAAVGVADTLMLGYVNQTALAAGSLAGQIQFLLNMINGGLAAGITILSAQYWGRGDLSAVEKVLAIGLNAVFIFGWIPGIPPLGFIAAFVWNLPPLWVYLILSCDEFAKMPFVYIRYRQKKWLRNITKEVTA